MSTEQPRTTAGVGGRGRGPRLLAATGPLLMTPLERVLDAIAEAGFDGVELMVGHHEDTQDPEVIRRRAADAGLDVPVVHGPYLLLLRTVLGSSYAAKTEASLQLAAEVGADVLVAHAPFRWERGARRWLAEQVDDLADAHGVRFAMENLFPVRGRRFSSVVTPEDMAGHRHLVLDTSHCAVSGIDLFDMWRATRESVVHLHVSDNFGNGKDSHAPIGTGMLPLAAFLGEVGASGWDGTITLELDCRAHLDDHDGLVRFLARERTKAAQLLAGERALA